jgi:hypothetical protein
MFFAQQAPKILSLTVFLKDSSDSLPNKAVKLVRKDAPLIWATTQSCCLMFYPQTLPKAAEPSKGSLQSRFPAALQRCVYIGYAQKRNTQPAPLHKKLLACARLLPQSCDSAPNTAPSQPFYFKIISQKLRRKHATSCFLKMLIVQT